MINIKDAIIAALSGVERTGIANLIKWLHEMDFFTAPASTMFHGNYEGGLAEHSWNVYDLLVKKNEQFQTQYLTDTLVICGILHDLCKTGMYVENLDAATDAQLFRLDKEAKKYKHRLPKVIDKQYASDLIGWYVSGAKGEMPEYRKSYKVEDQFPIGHGEKSVILAQKFIKLTDEEILAIRWHMASFDAGIHFNFPSGFAFRNACERLPLVTMLFTADTEASNILEA